MKLPYTKKIILSFFLFFITLPVYSETRVRTFAPSHFVIIFDRPFVSDQIADEILSAFDKAYDQMINVWKFPKPFYMKNKRLDIYLVPQEKLGPSILGTFHSTGLLRSEPWIDIGIIDPKTFNIKLYNQTIFHEFFHAIQYGGYEYSHLGEAPKWFIESTAEAMADEGLDSIGEVPYFITYQDAFEYGPPIPGGKQAWFMISWHNKNLCRTNGDHEYMSSIFFSYLIREFKDLPQRGVDIINHLWEKKPLREFDACLFLEKFVGGEEAFAKVLNNVATASLVGSKLPSPFGFSDNRMIPAIHRIEIPFSMKRDTDHPGYFKKFEPSSGFIIPLFGPMAPYSVIYMHFNDPQFRTSWYVPRPLHISASSFDPSIKYQPVLMKSDNSATLASADISHIYTIDDPSQWENYLVMTNASSKEGEVQISGVRGDPSFIKEVNIEDITSRTKIYEAHWEEYSPPLRSSRHPLKESLNNWTFHDKDHGTKQRFKFKVLTSDLVEDLTLHVQGNIYPFGKGKIIDDQSHTNEGILYILEQDLTLDKNINTLPLLFKGKDYRDNPLQVDPYDKALLFQANQKPIMWTVWSGYNPKNFSGDQNHIIKISHIQDSTPPQNPTQVTHSTPAQIEYCYDYTYRKNQSKINPQPEFILNYPILSSRVSIPYDAPLLEKVFCGLKEEGSQYGRNYKSYNNKLKLVVIPEDATHVSLQNTFIDTPAYYYLDSPDKITVKFLIGGNALANAIQDYRGLLTIYLKVEACDSSTTNLPEHEVISFKIPAHYSLDNPHPCLNDDNEEIKSNWTTTPITIQNASTQF